MDAYDNDFEERESAARDHGSWKFERRQHFEEQDDPSRDALGQGRWDEALRLLEEERSHWAAIAQEDERRGTPFRRVRVVETPHSLHAMGVARPECAGDSRYGRSGRRRRAIALVGADPPAAGSGRHRGQVLYEVMYTETGVLKGEAVRRRRIRGQLGEVHRGSLYDR
ncbi:DUF6879 family protein [Streptomyces sp. M19]